jgi:nitrogen regulatory protein PII
VSGHPRNQFEQVAVEAAKAMGETGDGTTDRRSVAQKSPLRSSRPFKIIAMVKPFRAQAVLSALESVQILGGTVREAMGYGRQKNRLGQYLGSEYNTSFLPKVQLTVFVDEEQVPAAIKAIVGQARTGRIGDGKILLIPCLGESLSW